MWVGIGRTHEEFWKSSPYQIVLTFEGYSEVQGGKKRKGTAADAQKLLGGVAGKGRKDRRSSAQ